MVGAGIDLGNNVIQAPDRAGSPRAGCTGYPMLKHENCDAWKSQKCLWVCSINIQDDKFSY